LSQGEELVDASSSTPEPGLLLSEQLIYGILHAFQQHSVKHLAWH